MSAEATAAAIHKKPGPKPNPLSANQQRLAKLKPRTRPVAFDAAVAQNICDRIARGETLRAIVFYNPTMPTHETWWDWLRANPTLASQVARAREASAGVLVDEALQISDDTVTADSHEAIAAAKLRVDTRKWVASKYAPKQFGDRLDVTGDLTMHIAIQRFTDAPEAIDVTPGAPSVEGPSE